MGAIFTLIKPSFTADDNLSYFAANSQLVGICNPDLLRQGILNPFSPNIRIANPNELRV